MDVKLARDVANWAELHPEDYNPGSWIEADVFDENPDGDRFALSQFQNGACKTAACIAGHVMLVRAPADWMTDGEGLYDGIGDHISDIQTYAAQQLGISMFHAGSIFYTGAKTAIMRLRYLADHPDVTDLTAAVPYQEEDDYDDDALR